jgi:YegS/Rv2252/BmrU family lipid kinase
MLVVNPMSRRGLRHRDAALHALVEADIEVREVVTSHPGHASEVLRARSEVWDAVFVLGGDGTVMEVVSALAFSGVPIGVLPGGTGNLIAGVLGVPFSVGHAVRKLLEGNRCTFDLGMLPDGRFFTFAAGVGVDVAMVQRTSQGGKRRLGMLSYAITATRAALMREMVQVTVDVDGKVLEARAVLAMVANAGSILGGRFSIGPNVKPDDGELDLCLFMPETFGEVLELFWRLLRRDFRPHPRMQFVRGKRFQLRCDPAVFVQADGDIVGRTPLEIRVAPMAAEFLVPRQRA